MQKLINQTKDLFEKLLVRDKKYTEDFSAIADKRVKCDADAAANESKKTELDKREKKIKSIEDVVKLQREVSLGHLELIDSKKLLKKEKDEFDVYKNNSMDQVKADAAEVAGKREKLTKQELLLSKAKEEYKDEVMDSVNKTLKQKGRRI